MRGTRVKRCPRCGSELARRYGIECASAIRGLWKPRLVCTSRDCGATGLHDPVFGRWISFDDLATLPHVIRDSRACDNGCRADGAQGSA